MATEKKGAINADMLITLLVGIVCLYMLLGSGDFRPLGRLFPRIVGGVALLACAAQFILFLRAKGKGGAKPTGPRNHLLIAGIGVAYLLLLPFAGFILSTVVLMAGVPLALGYKNHKVIWPLAVLFTLAFYFVFRTFFYVPLPQGPLTFI
jgi:hypothetical protein